MACTLTSHYFYTVSENIFLHLIFLSIAQVQECSSNTLPCPFVLMGLWWQICDDRFVMLKLWWWYQKKKKREKKSACTDAENESLNDQKFSKNPILASKKKTRQLWRWYMQVLCFKQSWHEPQSSHSNWTEYTQSIPNH